MLGPAPRHVPQTLPFETSTSVYNPVGGVILWPIFVIFPRSRKKRNPGEVLRVSRYTLPVANLPPGYYTRSDRETL